MTAINKQAHRIATWLSRAAFRTELNSLSDRVLEDIGLARYRSGLEASKPFWMA